MASFVQTFTLIATGSITTAIAFGSSIATAVAFLSNRPWSAEFAIEFG